MENIEIKEIEEAKSLLKEFSETLETLHSYKAKLNKYEALIDECLVKLAEMDVAKLPE